MRSPHQILRKWLDAEGDDDIDLVIEARSNILDISLNEEGEIHPS